VKLLSPYRFWLLILFVLACTCAAAQDDATTKFIDSLKKPPLPEAVVDTSVTVTEETSDSTVEEVPVDTAIVSRLKKMNADTVALLKKDKGFYYQAWLDSLLRVDAVKLPQKQPPINLSFLDGLLSVFNVILWLAVAALLVFVVYKLFLGNSPLFIKGRKNIEATIHVEEEEIAAGKYDALITRAEAEENYRLAVRYLYLQSLHYLSVKGFIRLGTEKTNYQYAGELRNSRPAIAVSFAGLTWKYEYIWYGEYMIANTTYYALKTAFTGFNNQTA
jgi:hypothetical protein